MNIILILQNPSFTQNIKNLKLSVGYIPDTENILTKRLLQIINSQKNLKKISFNHDNLLLYQSLKDSNCTNTLKTIMFYHVDFNNMINFNEVIEQLNVLESVHIIYCRSLNTHFIQQMINLTKSFKLKSLFIIEVVQVQPFQLLLEKYGNCIENLGLGLPGNCNRLN